MLKRILESEYIKPYGSLIQSNFNSKGNNITELYHTETNAKYVQFEFSEKLVNAIDNNMFEKGTLRHLYLVLIRQIRYILSYAHTRIFPLNEEN